MRFLKGLKYAVAYLSVYPGGGWNRRRILNQNDHQAELASIAGPVAKYGCPLSVNIELVPDPEPPGGEFRVRCLIAGKMVGEMDHNNGLVWHRRVVTAARAGRSVILPGHIVGGASRASGHTTTDYEVIFADYLGDTPQDKELMDLVTLEELVLNREGVTFAGRSLRWSELVGVCLHTTSDGWFAENVFWHLLDDQGVRVCVPHSQSQGLLERLQLLPEFDDQAVMSAMASASDADFVAWRGAPGQATVCA